MTSKEDIVRRVGKQLSSPVQWEMCMRHALQLGTAEFIEIGPKPVLSQLMRSISKAVRVSFLSFSSFRPRTICSESEIASF